MNWTKVSPLTYENNVSSFECYAEYSFPPDFVEVAINYNGGTASSNVFAADDLSHHSIKKLLSFNKEDMDSIWDTYECYQDCFEDKYVPFAVSKADLYFCFRTDDDNIGVLDPDTGEFSEIAEDFAEFKTILNSQEEDD